MRELEKAGFADIQVVADAESVLKMVDGGEVKLPENDFTGTIPG